MLLSSPGVRADVSHNNLKSLVRSYHLIQAADTDDDRYLESINKNVLLTDQMGERRILETRIYRKQLLLEAIFKQAILEIHGLESAIKISELMLYGVVPDADRELVPAITQLFSQRALFEIVFLLLQREEAVQLVALEILRFEGAPYPSGGNFAQGLAHFTAANAADAKLFSQALDVHEHLYKLLKKHPGFVLGNIGTEFSDRAFDPALVARLSDQAGKRRGPLREDLLVGLARLTGAAACGPMLELAPEMVDKGLRR